MFAAARGVIASPYLGNFSIDGCFYLQFLDDEFREGLYAIRQRLFKSSRTIPEGAGDPLVRSLVSYILDDLWYAELTDQHEMVLDIIESQRVDDEDDLEWSLAVLDSLRPEPGGHQLLEDLAQAYHRAFDLGKPFGVPWRDVMAAALLGQPCPFPAVVFRWRHALPEWGERLAKELARAEQGMSLSRYVSALELVPEHEWVDIRIFSRELSPDRLCDQALNAMQGFRPTHPASPPQDTGTRTIYLETGWENEPAPSVRLRVFYPWPPRAALEAELACAYQAHVNKLPPSSKAERLRYVRSWATYILAEKVSEADGKKMTARLAMELWDKQARQLGGRRWGIPPRVTETHRREIQFSQERKKLRDRVAAIRQSFSRS